MLTRGVRHQKYCQERDELTFISGTAAVSDTVAWFFWTAQGPVQIVDAFTTPQFCESNAHTESALLCNTILKRLPICTPFQSIFYLLVSFRRSPSSAAREDLAKTQLSRSTEFVSSQSNYEMRMKYSSALHAPNTLNTNRLLFARGLEDI